MNEWSFFFLICFVHRLCILDPGHPCRAVRACVLRRITTDGPRLQGPSPSSICTTLNVHALDKTNERASERTQRREERFVTCLSIPFYFAQMRERRDGTMLKPRRFQYFTCMFNLNLNPLFVVIRSSFNNLWYHIIPYHITYKKVVVEHQSQ